jgi:hypothetical protein
MNGELNWANDAHKGLVVGDWQDGVTTRTDNQSLHEIRNHNPATLNKPAIATFRQSVEAARLYAYSPVTIGNAQTQQ